MGEQLVAFYRRYILSVYMPNKPDKYNLKIIMINYSKKFDMMHGVPYVGALRPAIKEAIPTFFVRKLVEACNIAGSNRNVTMDNWFTSVPLFESLQKKYQLTDAVTILKNKLEIPASFVTSGKVGPS